MDKIITRCGYRCDLCMAYKPNIKSPVDQQSLSDGWFKYFGFRIPAEEIICEGCLNDGKLIDTACQVRPCVIEKGHDHCGQCENMFCEKLKERIVDVEEMLTKHGTIPAEDFEKFIKPYANKLRLLSLRYGDKD